MDSIMIFFSGIVLGTCFGIAYSVINNSSGNLEAARIADLYCLKLLSVSLEEANYIKHTKHKMMKKFKTHSPEHIKLLKTQDDYNVGKWKKEAIERLLSRHPKSYKSLVGYHDWDSAVRWLNKETKKNI